ncbi:MAG: SDR family NAD(P)-dependent oxidoreductase, partial [Candidatus Krumholzibacteriia bacterium]
MSPDVDLPALDGRVCVVTGATRGIGRSIALTLGGAGARVAFAYRKSEEAARTLLEELRGLGREAHAARLDVADFEAAQSFAEEVLEKLGDVDVLVNNAGVNA